MSVNNFFDFVQSLVVVGIRVDAEPVFAEVDTAYLVGQQSHADVGSEVAHPWNGAHFIADLSGNASLRSNRGARLGNAMREEVALLEFREQRLTERRNDRKTDDHDERSTGKNGQRPANNGGKHRSINNMQPADENWLVMLDGCISQEDVAQGRCNRKG